VRLEKLAEIELNKKYNADNMCTVVDEKTIMNSKDTPLSEVLTIMLHWCCSGVTVVLQ
jgi:hypothetical protein